MQIVRDWFRVVSVVLWLGLTGCGGSGGASGDSGDSTAARAGIATIDAKGGRVEAVLAGGIQLALDAPEGALKAATTIMLTPVATPPDAFGAFTYEPANLRFGKPTTLSVTLPAGAALDADTVLLLDRGSLRIPLGGPIDPVTRRIEVDLGAFGNLTTSMANPDRANAMSAGSAVRQAASSSVQVTLILGRSTYPQSLTLLENLVDALAAQGSDENAINVAVAMRSILANPQGQSDVRVRQAIVTWESVVCAQQQFNVSALDTFAGSDVTTFHQRAKDARTWDLLALELNALVNPLSSPKVVGCPNLNSDELQPIRNRLPAFLVDVTQALNLLDLLVKVPDPDPDNQMPANQLFNLRLPELFDLAADFGAFNALDLQNSVLATITGQLAHARNIAYTACRDIRDQSLQAKLLAKIVGGANLAAVAEYSEQDLHEDIQFCGMPIHWKLLDANGTDLRHGDVGGIGMGLSTTAASLNVNGTSKLVLSGPLGALICPSGSANSEQLSVSAGPLAGAPTSVQTLTPSNANGYLESSTLDFDLATLLSQGVRKLTIVRQGSLCNGGFVNLGAHAPIAILTLDTSITPLFIGVDAIKGVIVNTSYTATLTATGGVPPYTFQATQLPGGMSLNASTGVISGTPTAIQTLNPTFSVTDASGATVTSPRQLNVVPLIAGSYASDPAFPLRRTKFGPGGNILPDGVHFEFVQFQIAQDGDQVSGEVTVVSSPDSRLETFVPSDSFHPGHLTGFVRGNGINLSWRLTGNCAGTVGGSAIFTAADGANPARLQLFRLAESDCHAVPGVREELDGDLVGQ